MSYGLRFIRDLLWVAVFMAAFVIVYRVFAGGTMNGDFVNVSIALGAVAALLLAIPSRYKAKSMDNECDVTSFDEGTGSWLPAVSDTFPRVTFLALLAFSLAAGIVQAGALDADFGSDKVLPPRAADNLRQELRIDGDQDGDAIVFNHAIHQELAGGEDGCVECHHINRPGDQTASCYHCHSSMTRTVSIFDHGLHQARLGGNESCDDCHDLSKPKSRENSKRCVDCHKDDMNMAEPASGERFNDMAPPYPVAMHNTCVECHREKSSEMKGCLGCCDTCHQAVSQENKVLNFK